MLFPFKVANKTRFEAPFGARWIYIYSIYLFYANPEVGASKGKNAALSQEQRASWNCDVWCVTTRNYYSWAGWTGFVVDSFLRVRKHEKERDFMVHHLEDMFSKKTFYWLLQSKEKPCIYTIYICVCVCLCTSAAQTPKLSPQLYTLYVCVYAYCSLINLDLAIWHWITMVHTHWKQEPLLHFAVVPFVHGFRHCLDDASAWHGLALFPLL